MDFTLLLPEIVVLAGALLVLLLENLTKHVSDSLYTNPFGTNSSSAPFQS